jgi:hypothetical protein
MKTSIARLIAAAMALLTSDSTTPAKELEELSLLYVGSERAAEFLPFLQRNVARVETKTREGFRPAEAASFDVVLLDWPQTGRSGDFPPKSSPLGKREEWTRPTVLLGSAGLNLAVVWKLKGGDGLHLHGPAGLRPASARDLQPSVQDRSSEDGEDPHPGRFPGGDQEPGNRGLGIGRGLQEPVTVAGRLVQLCLRLCPEPGRGILLRWSKPQDSHSGRFVAPGQLVALRF